MRAILSVPPSRAGEADCGEALAKVTRRLIPFLVACYVAAYLDRVNIGFAALSMNEDLGLSPVLFGWGAGIFFLGYALFEVPSNLILHRVGARRWIARIMVSWGIVSGLMALVSDGSSFLALRFLLGVAEAGFFPGILLYLTYWIPAEYRARILARFLIAIPVATIIGAPLSGVLLATMQGVGGLKGWQWLFIIEALPAVTLGVAAFRYLTDRPKDAAWLTPVERGLLQAELDREQDKRETALTLTVWQALRHPPVIALGIAYFGIVSALYGLGFWLPQIVASFGFAPLGTGLITAIPYIVGALTMLVWSRMADRTQGHAWHAALAACIAAIGLAVGACLTSPIAVIFAITIAAAGTLAAFPIFWALPMAFLSTAAAAAGIALINSIGNLAGFAGPYLVGWIKSASGEYAYALLALAVGPIGSALLLVCLRQTTRGPYGDAEQR